MEIFDGFVSELIIVFLVSSIFLFSLYRGFQGVLWDLGSLFNYALFFIKRHILNLPFISRIQAWRENAYAYSIISKGSIEDLRRQGFELEDDFSTIVPDLRKSIGVAYILLLINLVVDSMLLSVNILRDTLYRIIDAGFNYNTKLMGAEDIGTVRVRCPLVEVDKALPKWFDLKLFEQKKISSVVLASELLRHLLQKRKKITTDGIFNIERIYEILILSSANTNLYYDNAAKNGDITVKKISFVKNIIDDQKKEIYGLIDHFDNRVIKRKGTETFQQSFRNAVSCFPEEVWGYTLKEFASKDHSVDPYVHFIFTSFRNLSKVLKVAPPKISAKAVEESEMVLDEKFSDMIQALNSFAYSKTETLPIIRVMNCLDELSRSFFTESGHHQKLDLQSRLNRQFKPSCVGYSSLYVDVVNWNNLSCKLLDKRNFSPLGSNDCSLGDLILSESEVTTETNPWKEPIWDTGKILNKECSLMDMTRIIAAMELPRLCGQYWTFQSSGL